MISYLHAFFNYAIRFVLVSCVQHLYIIRLVHKYVLSDASEAYILV
jgi:hypothetical protein